MRSLLLPTLGWLAAVVLATAVGIGAVTLVSAEVGAPVETVTASEGPSAKELAERKQAKRERDRARARAAAGGTVAGPRGGGGSGSGAAATQVTDGGSVTARCTQGEVRLTTWAPASGWTVTGEDLSGTTHGVVFEDGSTVVSVRVRCEGGTPEFSVFTPTSEPSESPGPDDPDDGEDPNDEPTEQPSPEPSEAQRPGR